MLQAGAQTTEGGPKKAKNRENSIYQRIVSNIRRDAIESKHDSATCCSIISESALRGSIPVAQCKLLQTISLTPFESAYAVKAFSKKGNELQTDAVPQENFMFKSSIYNVNVNTHLQNLMSDVLFPLVDRSNRSIVLIKKEKAMESRYDSKAGSSSSNVVDELASMSLDSESSTNIDLLDEKSVLSTGEAYFTLRLLPIIYCGFYKIEMGDWKMSVALTRGASTLALAPLDIDMKGVSTRALDDSEVTNNVESDVSPSQSHGSLLKADEKFKEVTEIGRVGGGMNASVHGFAAVGSAGVKVTTENVPGMTLFQLIRESRPCSHRTLLRWAYQIFGTIHSAHLSFITFNGNFDCNDIWISSDDCIVAAMKESRNKFTGYKRLHGKLRDYMMKEESIEMQQLRSKGLFRRDAWIDPTKWILQAGNAVINSQVKGSRSSPSPSPPTLPNAKLSMDSLPQTSSYTLSSEAVGVMASSSSIIATTSDVANEAFMKGPSIFDHNDDSNSLSSVSVDDSGSLASLTSTYRQPVGFNSKYTSKGNDNSIAFFSSPSQTQNSKKIATTSLPKMFELLEKYQVKGPEEYVHCEIKGGNDDVIKSLGEEYEQFCRMVQRDMRSLGIILVQILLREILSHDDLLLWDLNRDNFSMTELLGGGRLEGGGGGLFAKCPKEIMSLLELCFSPFERPIQQSTLGKGGMGGGIASSAKKLQNSRINVSLRSSYILKCSDLLAAIRSVKNAAEASSQYVKTELWTKADERAWLREIDARKAELALKAEYTRANAITRIEEENRKKWFFLQPESVQRRILAKKAAQEQAETNRKSRIYYLHQAAFHTWTRDEIMKWLRSGILKSFRDALKLKREIEKAERLKLRMAKKNSHILALGSGGVGTKALAQGNMSVFKRNRMTETIKPICPPYVDKILISFGLPCCISNPKATQFDVERDFDMAAKIIAGEISSHISKFITSMMLCQAIDTAIESAEKKVNSNSIFDMLPRDQKVEKVLATQVEFLTKGSASKAIKDATIKTMDRIGLNNDKDWVTMTINSVAIAILDKYNACEELRSIGATVAASLMAAVYRQNKVRRMIRHVWKKAEDEYQQLLLTEMREYKMKLIDEKIEMEKKTIEVEEGGSNIKCDENGDTESIDSETSAGKDPEDVRKYQTFDYPKPYNSEGFEHSAEVRFTMDTSVSNFGGPRSSLKYITVVGVMIKEPEEPKELAGITKGDSKLNENLGESLHMILPQVDINQIRDIGENEHCAYNPKSTIDDIPVFTKDSNDICGEIVLIVYDNRQLTDTRGEIIRFLKGARSTGTIAKVKQARKKKSPKNDKVIESPEIQDTDNQDDANVKEKLENEEAEDKRHSEKIDFSAADHNGNEDGDSYSNCTSLPMNSRILAEPSMIDCSIKLVGNVPDPVWTRSAAKKRAQALALGLEPTVEGNPNEKIYSVEIKGLQANRFYRIRLLVSDIFKPRQVWNRDYDIRLKRNKVPSILFLKDDEHGFIVKTLPTTPSSPVIVKTEVVFSVSLLETLDDSVNKEQDIVDNCFHISSSTSPTLSHHNIFDSQHINPSQSSMKSSKIVATHNDAIEGLRFCIGVANLAEVAAAVRLSWSHPPCNGSQITSFLLQRRFLVVDVADPIIAIESETLLDDIRTTKGRWKTVKSLEPRKCSFTEVIKLPNNDFNTIIKSTVSKLRNLRKIGKHTFLKQSTTCRATHERKEESEKRAREFPKGIENEMEMVAELNGSLEASTKPNVSRCSPSDMKLDTEKNMPSSIISIPNSGFNDLVSGGGQTIKSSFGLSKLHNEQQISAGSSSYVLEVKKFSISKSIQGLFGGIGDTKKGNGSISSSDGNEPKIENLPTQGCVSSEILTNEDKDIDQFELGPLLPGKRRRMCLLVQYRLRAANACGNGHFGEPFTTKLEVIDIPNPVFQEDDFSRFKGFNNVDDTSPCWKKLQMVPSNPTEGSDLVCLSVNGNLTPNKFAATKSHQTNKFINSACFGLVQKTRQLTKRSNFFTKILPNPIMKTEISKSEESFPQDKSIVISTSKFPTTSPGGLCNNQGLDASVTEVLSRVKIDNTITIDMDMIMKSPLILASEHLDQSSCQPSRPQAPLHKWDGDFCREGMAEHQSPTNKLLDWSMWKDALEDENISKNLSKVPVAMLCQDDTQNDSLPWWKRDADKHPEQEGLASPSMIPMISSAKIEDKIGSNISDEVEEEMQAWLARLSFASPLNSNTHHQTKLK